MAVKSLHKPYPGRPQAGFLPVTESADRSSQAAPSPTGASLDDPLYYLHNFQWLLDWVMARYGDLLELPECEFAQHFEQLPEPSRALLVRMVMRKGERFRADRLRYPEIGTIPVAAEPLKDLGWLESGPILTLEQLFALFTWPELRIMLADTLESARVNPKSGKREALTVLAGMELEARTAPEWGAGGLAVYRLTVMPLADRFRWLFFGNPYQDWSEFVLTELGLFEYEPVVFDEASRPVHSRPELNQYWQLQACRQQLSEQAPLADIAEAIPRLHTHNPWLVRTLDRLLFRLGREWERAGELALAREVYEVSGYPGTRGRLLRVLERQEAFERAWNLARSAERNPESEAEAQQLERVIPRLRRRLGLSPEPRPKPQTPETIELVLPASAPVEVAVANRLQTPEAPVYYQENTLVTGLFGLLFWDAIFSPVSGAFFHPFQRGPADLYWPDFYQRRAALFEQGFAALEEGRHIDRILGRFQEKYGRQSPFVHWGALGEELIELALTCIPAEHLRLCFKRLLRDLKANRAGLPDLIQFWPHEQRYRMIEVKGPGDRLQDNQKRWLAFFAEHRMPVSVCHVRWNLAEADGGEAQL